MKRLCLLSLLAFIHCVAIAQIFNHKVVLQNGDTIKGVLISKDKNLTNQQQLTFTDLEGQVYNYTSSEVLSHHNGNEYFQSHRIYNKRNNHFISMIINGPVKMYRSWINPRRKAYYVEVEGNDDIYYLEDHQLTLDSLFGKILPGYFDFRAQYHWRPIHYTERSIGQVITAYNTGNAPLKGNGKYDLTAEMYMGAFLGIEPAWFSWSRAPYSLTDISTPVGLFFVLEYDRRLSINGLISFQRYRFRGDTDDIAIKRFSFEPYLSFKYYYNQKLSINPGFGVMASWNQKAITYNAVSIFPANIQAGEV